MAVLFMYNQAHGRHVSVTIRRAAGFCFAEESARSSEISWLADSPISGENSIASNLAVCQAKMREGVVISRSVSELSDDEQRSSTKRKHKKKRPVKASPPVAKLLFGRPEVMTRKAS